MSDDQGTVYSAYIAGELEQERARRDRFDARGLGVLTTSSALIALVFSLTVLITGKDLKIAKVSSIVLAAVALVAFLVAGISGLLANKLRNSSTVLIEGMERMVRDRWTNSEVTARSVTAQKNLEVLASLRNANDKKVKHLERALFSQLVGTGLLVWAIGREALALVGWWP